MNTKKRRTTDSSKFGAFCPGILFFLLAGLVLLPGGISAQEQIAGEWLRFELTGSSAFYDWSASSALEAEQTFTPSRYGPGKALDGDLSTSWAEGAEGAGIGEWFTLALYRAPEALGFHNGYGENRNLFSKNNRVKELSLRFYAGLNISGFATEWTTFFDALPISDARTVRLSDSMEAQRISLPFNRAEIEKGMREFRESEAVRTWDFPQAEEMNVDGSEGLARSYRLLIRMEITDVYQGTNWDDTCITELWPDYGAAERVFVSGNGSSLMMEKSGGETIRSYEPFGSVLTLVESSRNNRWAVLIKEDAYNEGGRVESEYVLVHVPTGRDMTKEILGTSPVLGTELLPTGFAGKYSRTFVEYEDFSTGQTRRVRCSLYRK